VTAAARFLVSALVVAASASPVDAQPATSLLKPLGLVGYSSSTTPPYFSGRTIDARQLSTTELRGKVVLVNFWASWCLECRPEMPVLERLHRELAPRGFAVVGINAREAAAPVRQYAKDLGLTFPLVLDTDGTINASYGVIGLPTTFLAARDGRAVAFAVGPREWGGAAARSLIEALLAEPASRPGTR
jgi:cytochrome c biogenesis protein CcmG/thiol:disulfide interchange protein DsbE